MAWHLVPYPSSLELQLQRKLNLARCIGARRTRDLAEVRIAESRIRLPEDRMIRQADAEQSVLPRDGQVVPLGLKAFELLLFLLRQRGQVMKKDELLRQVWPDTVVEENNLVRD